MEAKVAIQLNQIQVDSISLHDDHMDNDDDFVVDLITNNEDISNVGDSSIYIRRPLITVVPDKTKYLRELSLLSTSTLENVDSLKVPTLPGYNKELMKSNLADVDVGTFLLIPDSASGYSAIHTSPMLVQNITRWKTIVALDLNLYERALQLRNSRDDLCDIFILRLGELQIVFAQIRAIGKFT